jgi:hypothetical protein
MVALIIRKQTPTKARWLKTSLSAILEEECISKSKTRRDVAYTSIVGIESKLGDEI